MSDVPQTTGEVLLELIELLEAEVAEGGGAAALIRQAVAHLRLQLYSQGGSLQIRGTHYIQLRK